MQNILPTLTEDWNSIDTIFSLSLILALLVMLYTLSLIHNKLRLLENELQNLRKDQSVISDELEEMLKMSSPSANGTDSLSE